MTVMTYLLQFNVKKIKRLTETTKVSVGLSDWLKKQLEWVFLVVCFFRNRYWRITISKVNNYTLISKSVFAPH